MIAANIFIKMTKIEHIQIFVFLNYSKLRTGYVQFLLFSSNFYIDQNIFYLTIRIYFN
jgi:hypothetical protein